MGPPPSSPPPHVGVTEEEVHMGQVEGGGAPNISVGASEEASVTHHQHVTGCSVFATRVHRDSHLSN